MERRNMSLSFVVVSCHIRHSAIGVHDVFVSLFFLSFVFALNKCVVVVIIAIIVHASQKQRQSCDAFESLATKPSFFFGRRQHVFIFTTRFSSSSIFLLLLLIPFDVIVVVENLLCLCEFIWCNRSERSERQSENETDKRRDGSQRGGQPGHRTIFSIGVDATNTWDQAEWYNDSHWGQQKNSSNSSSSRRSCERPQQTYVTHLQSHMPQHRHSTNTHRHNAIGLWYSSFS